MTSVPIRAWLLSALSLCGGVLDAGCGRSDRLALEPASAPRAETDEEPLFHASIDGDDRVQPLGLVRHAFMLPDGRALTVDATRTLWVTDGERTARLLDGVLGVPVLRTDAVVAARATAPGESDLWLVPLGAPAADATETRRAPPRALAAQHGADGQPFVLDDGRVLFVSDRTGVASVFLVDPARDLHRAAQLTNVGERPGALSPAFVRPPVSWIAQDGARVRYVDGDRERTLDVPEVQ